MENYCGCLHANISKIHQVGTFIALIYFTEQTIAIGPAQAGPTKKTRPECPPVETALVLPRLAKELVPPSLARPTDL